MEPLVTRINTYLEQISTTAAVGNDCETADATLQSLRQDEICPLVEGWMRELLQERYVGEDSTADTSWTFPTSERVAWLSQIDLLLDLFQDGGECPEEDVAMMMNATKTRQALVLEVLAAVLRLLVTASENSDGKEQSAATDGAPLRRRRTEGKSTTDSTALNEELWSLQNSTVTDSFLMLTLFYAECSSMDDVALVKPLSAGLAALFELLLPMLCQETAKCKNTHGIPDEIVGDAGHHTDAHADHCSDGNGGVALLRQEVRSLRVMAMKRLERFTTYSSGSSRHPDAPELFQVSLWCLRAYYDTIAGLLVSAAMRDMPPHALTMGATQHTPLSHITNTNDSLSLSVLAGRIGPELVDIAGELLSPIHSTVNAVVRNSAVAKSSQLALRGAALAGAQALAETIPTASPLLLSTILRELERILWLCVSAFSQVSRAASAAAGEKPADVNATTSPAPPAPANPSFSLFTSLLSSVVHRLMADLLHVCQVHAQVQQRLQAENLRRGSEGEAAAAAAVSHRADPFGSFSVQRGVQAVLSVALDKLPLEVFHSSTLRAAATAALTACGGPLWFPPHPTASTEVEGRPGAEDDRSWVVDAVRPCRAVLEPRRAGGSRRGRRARGDHQHTGDDEGADALLEAEESDGEEDLEEGSGTLRGAGSLLTTSFGRFSAADLTEMVLQSLALVDLLQVDEVRGMHLEGLHEMQHRAALQAQREELERRRQMEREDVEAVPAAHLLARVNTNVLQTTGTELLRREASRAQLERAAFRSVLLSYQPSRSGVDSLSMESEAQVRVKQALLARCLVQLPTVYLDSAIDELLLRLRYELKALLREPRRQQEQLQLSGEASAESSAQKAWATSVRVLMNRLRDGYRSAYALVLQVLFTSYAALAPTHEERHIALLENADTDGVAGLTFFEDHLSEDGPGAGLVSRGTAGGGAGMVLQSSGGVSELAQLNTAHPVGFLLEDNSEASPGGQSSSSDTQSSRVGGQKPFFHDDTPRRPSMFSHILCRVMEVVLPLDRVMVLHILLEVPGLTRYVWHYIFDSFCLSQDELRCYTGIALLTDLAVRREAYRRNAVQLLLHLCVSPNSSARRLSIQKVGKLLSATDPAAPSGFDGSGAAEQKRLIGDDTVELLVEHAKLKVAAVPAFRLSATAAEVDLVVSTTYAETGDMDQAFAAVGDSRRVQLYQREFEKLTGQLHTHLGLFLMLCVREPKDLLPSILRVYQQCVERNNRLMARLLLENEDIAKMMLYLPHSNSLLFLLRSFSEGAGVFVQTLLQARITQIGREAEAANAARKSATTPEEGEAAGHTLRRLHDQMSAIVTIARAIWSASSIPLVEDRGADTTLYSSGRLSRPVLHDFRFLAPLVAFLSANELRTFFLPQFLYFVQVQMALQRTEGYELRKLSAKERQFVLSRRELRQFILSVIREIFLRHPIQLGIGKERPAPARLKRVDLLLYLHYAPEHTKQAELSAAAAAERGDKQAMQALHCPRISQITTKEVINACFELSVELPVSEPGEEPARVALFDFKETQAAVRRMMQNTKEGVPSQLLATLLSAAPRLVLTHGSEFLQMVRHLVLEPLAARCIWESNLALWTGVLHFTNAYYTECHGLLLHLPDQVLTKALRDFPLLMEKFHRENEHNASFAHIFEALHTPHPIA